MTNNISDKRYIDHWIEARFECAAPIKNSAADAAMMRTELTLGRWALQPRDVRARPRCAGFVLAHQARIAADISSYDGCVEPCVRLLER